MLKGVMGLIVLAALAMAISGAWAVKDLAPMDDGARADAPGSFIDLPQGTIHYRLRGPADGDLVVMVHGYSTPNFIFDQNADALLAAGYRVLQFDHYGRGYSDRPSARYDVDFYDAALLDLVTALGIEEPFVLVGLSMGGVISAEFTARHPGRVKQLALFVPAGFETNGGGGVTGALLRTPVIGDWIWTVFGRGVLTGDGQYDESALAPDARLQGDVTAQMAYRGYLPALLSTLRHLDMSDRDEAFAAAAASGTPMLAVFGDADTTIPIAAVDRLRAAAPQAEVYVVEGGTHGATYQRYDLVNPWLLGFLAGDED